MSYFNLRKQQPEPALDEPEEEAPDAEEAVEETVPEQPTKEYGPLLTGLFGPSRWLAANLGSSAAWTVHVVAVWAPVYYGGWTALLVPAGWLLAVLAFVPREHLERLADRIEKPATDEDQTAGEESVIDPIAAVLWQLIGDAPGTHLKTLAGRLQSAAPEQPVDRAAVRAKLRALGIPVRASVRDAAGRVNEGVHRDDLEAWEEAPSPTGTGTPSEARSDPGSDAVTSGVATRRTGVAMPLSRLRRLLPRGGT